MSENLVSGLSNEITRVSLKAQRWREQYLPELGEQAAVGMRLSLSIMEGEIAAARDALASGDILKMMPAYQSLKDYSDDD